VDCHQPAAGGVIANPDPEKFSIVSVVDGVVASHGGRRFAKGCFLLLPRGASPLTALEDAVVLQVTVP
jgi:mannose-6-phosphate isomerase